ncbi:hypothetical protein OIU34_19135 [Pararhizobium sp. BT-229]|uniref:hypothetical protein n=1 Tax=Pararhizobium sp. BT-229 TaxID=2986923 RepID=UPI0021F7238C|nr:hypothetical protein [Pararhizobium sp. BT-229]MCV9963997.1 hypothetical protein [Pararhizobium sp. BT-229]
MRLEFRHPAIASGIHAKSLQQRIMVGMVSTPVDLVELSRADVVTAYEVEGTNPDDDVEIIQHEGQLYQAADIDLTILLAKITNFEDFHFGLDSKKLPIMSIGQALFNRIEEISRAGTTASLFPLPRSPKIERNVASEEVIASYLSKTPAMPSVADAGEVEAWRELARQFVSNFVLVDGRTYRRAGVPIYCVGTTSIRPASTEVFSRFIDATIPSPLGGSLPGRNAYRGVMMRATELGEARSLRRDMFKKAEAEGPLLDSPRIICHVDVPLDDLEQRDLARFAKIHLYEYRKCFDDYEKQWKTQGLMRVLADPSSKLSMYRTAALAMKEALDAHQLRGEGIECVEAALRALSRHTFENRFTYENNQAKQVRCRELDVATTAMFERFDAMPIDVPVFSGNVMRPGL